MRFTERRFSVPDSALLEPMPGKMFKLLIFLLKCSDFGGACRPGYSAMKHALRDHDGDKGSNATIRLYLIELEQRGWIFHTKKTNGRMTIWLQVPPRFREQKPVSGCSIVKLPVVQSTKQPVVQS